MMEGPVMSYLIIMETRKLKYCFVNIFFVIKPKQFPVLPPHVKLCFLNALLLANSLK